MLKGVVSGIVFTLLLVGMLTLAFNTHETTSTFENLDKSQPSKNSIVSSLYENVTIHNGNLIIDGIQTFIIENCTYIQTGNIEVKDYGKLVARNVEIQINQSYFNQYELRVEDYAALVLEDAFLGSDWPIDLRFMGHSSITFNKVVFVGIGFGDFYFDEYSSADICNFTFEKEYNMGFGGYSQGYITNSTIHYIGPAETSHVRVSNSTILIVELWFADGETVDVHGLRSGFSEYLDLREKVSSSYHAFDLELSSTSANWWLNVPYSSRTTISDSTIALFGVDVSPSISISLEGLEPGFYEFKNIGGITLNKTGITECMRVHMVGARDSICTISDSKVHLFPGCNSIIYLTDSVVEYIITSGRNFYGSLHFDNTTCRGISTFTSSFYMYGNISFKDFGDISWHLSNITRNYNVIAREINGSATENVELVLFDHDNSNVWNGLTDNLGEANINITFTDSNYTDTLRLEAVKGNLSAIASIAFLSDTPVTLTLGAHDVAATSIALCKTVVGQGFILPINITVMNKGGFAENFNVTGYANATSMGTQTVSNLSNGTSTTLTFNWNTTGLAYGNYAVSGHAWSVQGETDLANNNCTSECVVVTVPGDIKGDFTVDIYDALLLSGAFNSRLSSANWSPNADINGDNVVDIYDAILLANNYGKTA